MAKITHNYLVDNGFSFHGGIPPLYDKCIWKDDEGWRAIVEIMYDDEFDEFCSRSWIQSAQNDAVSIIHQLVLIKTDSDLDQIIALNLQYR